MPYASSIHFSCPEQAPYSPTGDLLTFRKCLGCGLQEYPHVPTPKELVLSRQLVDLQQEKDVIEGKLMAQIHDLESQIHKCVRLLQKRFSAGCRTAVETELDLFDRLQVRIHDISQQLQATMREQVHGEQQAVEKDRAEWRDRFAALQRELDQEKNDKAAQKKWRDKFTTSRSSEETNHNQPVYDAEVKVDPLEDALAKFAQNIALLPARAAPKAAQAGVLPFLVHLVREHFSDVVTGSVLVALVHLAISHKPERLRRHRAGNDGVSIVQPEGGDAMQVAVTMATKVNVKDEIVKAGIAAPLARILETVRNQRVLCEASRLCAALSSFVPNKRVLAAKNVVRFLIHILLPGVFQFKSSTEPQSTTQDLLLDTQRLEKIRIEIVPELQRFALSALVNLSHGTIYEPSLRTGFDSEVIRSQIVNFQFIPTAVRYLRESDDVAVQAEAAKLLGNLAFNHVVNQSAILTAEGDACLTKRLTSESLTKSRVLVRASAIGVGNLAYTAVNQLTIGYGDAMTFLLQLLVDSTDPLVIEAAAVALCAICHQSPLNKSRAVAQNGLQVLLYVVSRSHRYGNDEDAIVAALECLCVLARPKPARQQVMELDGHLPLCQLCRTTKSSALLVACGMAISVLIPTRLERHVMLTDGKDSKLETSGLALSVLKRVRHLVYGSRGSDADSRIAVPLWLEHAISRLKSYAADTTVSMATITTTASPPEEDEPMEFHERSYYSMESLTEMEPDELCPQFYE